MPPAIMSLSTHPTSTATVLATQNLPSGQALKQRIRKIARPSTSVRPTHLPYATTDLSWWDIRQYIEDYLSGNEGLQALLRGLIYSVYYTLPRRASVWGGPCAGFTKEQVGCGVVAFPPYRWKDT